MMGAVFLLREGNDISPSFKETFGTAAPNNTGGHMIGFSPYQGSL